MKKPPNRREWILGATFALVLGIVAWRVYWNRSGEGRRMDLAAANPYWTFRVTNDAPIEFDALFRVGNNIRVVRGRTPAEFRHGSRRLVAQFRPLDKNERLQVHSIGSSMGSSSMTFPAGSASTNVAVTFVSTFGRLGIPAVGAWGISVYPWGAREVYRKPWTLWPDTWQVTDEMLDALPAAEVWDPEAPARKVSEASDPTPPQRAK